MTTSTTPGSMDAAHLAPPAIGLAHTGTGSQLRTLADPALRPYRLRDLYLPDTAEDDFQDLDVLLVADRSHPRLLARHAEAVLEVARRGGTLVVLGENSAHQWLPGVRWQARPTNFWWWRTGEDHGMRLRSPEHPVWNYLSQRAVIWHHHGVFQAPEGTVPLVALEEDGVEAGVTTYLDEVSTPGAILVTSMDPCFHHGAGFMPGATQLIYCLLRWAEARFRHQLRHQASSHSQTV